MSPAGWRRLRCACLAALVFVIAPRAEAQYHTGEANALRIIVDADWVRQSAPGYLPVRVDLTNSGDARVIEIVGRSQRFSRTPGSYVQTGVQVRRVVRLARGDRVQLTVPMPIAADNESIAFEIREGEQTLQQFGFGTVESGRTFSDTGVLIVADPAGVFGKAAAGWLRPITTRSPYFGAPGPTGSAPPMDVLLPPARLPTDWLGFTSLRAVVVGPTEWAQLNDGQKDALLSWTACGGDLIFVDGSLSALFPEGRARPAHTTDGATARYFFGHIYFPAAASVASSGLAAVLTSFEGAVRDVDRALPANRARDWGRIVERGFQLPIPGVGRVPARAYVLILIAFTLLIGPVNYWFLWRRRQQVLLVVTTPLISALFVALLAGYVIAAEGFGVRGRVVSVTILDQGTKQASMRASASLYAAGMTPAGGLRFPRDVAVFPTGPDGRLARDRQSLDLTESQRYASGVIQARSPTNIEVIRFRPARERLSFTRDGDRLAVSNGLGATVTQLFYRDGNTAYTLTDPLPAGAKGILQGRPFGGAEMASSSPAIPAKLLHVFDTQPDGSYLAVLERSPFVELGTTGIEERDSYHVVLGVGETGP